MLHMERAHGRLALPTTDIEVDDQIAVLHVSWEQYGAISRTRCGRSSPRMAYLDGELEIMTTSARHDFFKKLIARLLEAYVDEMELDFAGYGSATYRKKPEQAGVEPDECYVVGLKDRSVPHVAIEVVVTHGGIDKLEIYRRLGVREVWFWIEDRFEIYAISETGRIAKRDRSAYAPGFDLKAIAKIVNTTRGPQQSAAVRAYRRSLRRRR